MHHTAASPSSQPTFLPSAYVRPLYEMPTSKNLRPACASRAVISG